MLLIEYSNHAPIVRGSTLWRRRVNPSSNALTVGPLGSASRPCAEGGAGHRSSSQSEPTYIAPTSPASSPERGILRWTSSASLRMHSAYLSRGCSSERPLTKRHY